MNMNDLLETVSKSLEIFEAEDAQLKAEIETLRVDAKVAHDAYYENVRQKEGVVEKRLALLTTMLANLETKAGQAQKAYTAAVIANDTSKMDSLQAMLAKLASQKLSTSAQIEALHRVNVKGESDLYEDAVIKAKAALELARTYQYNIGTISDTAKTIGEQWEKIKSASSSARRANLTYNLSDKLVKLNAHYSRPDIGAMEEKVL